MQCVQIGEIDKSSRTAALYEEREAAKPPERAFSDLADPMEHCFIGKSRYFVTLLDPYSGCSLVRCIERNSEVGEVEMELVRELENFLNERFRRLTSIYRDKLKWIENFGGGEYIGAKFSDWVKQR